jgi:molybdenum cofactor cytidylyltransferase
MLAESYSLTNVVNAISHEGIGSSISCGVYSLIESQTPLSGFGIFLGDLPFIKSGTISKLAAEFSFGKCSRITRPIYDGKAGHPVFFPIDFAIELSQLSEDRGASALFSHYSDCLNLVETSDSGVVRDIDTPDALMKKSAKKVS